jgi:hypothetical protein
LRDQHVGIAIDDQAGQSVGFAVHQSKGVGMPPRRQRFAQCERALDARPEEPRVHLLFGLEGPYACADLRCRAVRGAR